MTWMFTTLLVRRYCLCCHKTICLGRDILFSSEKQIVCGRVLSAGRMISVLRTLWFILSLISVIKKRIDSRWSLHKYVWFRIWTCWWSYITYLCGSNSMITSCLTCWIIENVFRCSNMKYSEKPGSTFYRILRAQLLLLSIHFKAVYEYWRSA